MHLTQKSTAPELLDLFFLLELQVFVYAPSIARLMDLAKAFVVVVVLEQLKKKIWNFLIGSVFLGDRESFFQSFSVALVVGLSFPFLPVSFPSFSYVLLVIPLPVFILFLFPQRIFRTAPRRSSWKKALSTQVAAGSVPDSLIICFHS